MAYDAPGGGIGRYARPAVPWLARGTCRCENCTDGTRTPVVRVLGVLGALGVLGVLLTLVRGESAWLTMLERATDAVLALAP
eukprot:5033455-Prymnesium_polylepis.1